MPAPSRSRCCRAAVSAQGSGLGTAAPRRRAGARARGARQARSSARPRPRSPRVPPAARRRAAPARRGHRARPRWSWPDRWRSPATSRSSAPRSADSSPSAVSSASSRQQAASRFASSSSATRSSRCAPSPFTQRALHPVEAAVIYPAAERVADLVEAHARRRRGRGRVRRPGRPRSRARRRAVTGGRTGARLGRRGARRDSAHRYERAGPAFPQAQPFSFEAQRPAVAARGLAEAGTELNDFVTGGNRVLVAFPHDEGAPHAKNLLRQADARASSRRRNLPEQPELLFAVAPASARLRLAGARSRPPPDTQVFPQAAAARRPPPRPRSPRSPTSAPATSSSTRPASRKLLGFETKEVASVTRLPLLTFRGEGPPVRPARAAGQGIEVHRRRRERARPLQARRQGLAEPEGACPRRRCELATELISNDALRAAAAGARDAVRPRSRSGSRSGSRRIPLPRDRGSGARDRVGEGGSGERRGRWTGSSAATSEFGKTRVAVRARLRRRRQRQADWLVCPTTILAEQHWNVQARYRDFPVGVEMVSRFRKPAETKQVLRDFIEGRSRC